MVSRNLFWMAFEYEIGAIGMVADLSKRRSRNRAG